MIRPPLLSLVISVALVGCASSGGVPESRIDRSLVSVDVPTGTTNMQLTRDAAITSASLTATPDQVWAALPKAFGELELAITELNSPAKVIASTGQRTSRIGRKNIANFLDCPGSYGNAANRSDVYLSVQSQVLPSQAPGGALVRTEVAASARSVTSGTTVPCSTNGKLETLLMETLTASLTTG